MRRNKEKKRCERTTDSLVLNFRLCEETKDVGCAALLRRRGCVCIAPESRLERLLCHLTVEKLSKAAHAQFTASRRGGMYNIIDVEF
jgi:hypothetical protein